MDNKSLTDSLIRTNQSILCSGLFNGPRLTPTGKISHAKTRVYTQRYRKEWEQMPDFRGWLTAVPDQATRAYCTFCKKNLHAHRLSLLKHTCTMKHQRAALMHQNELMNAQRGTGVKIADTETGYEDGDPEMARKDCDRVYDEDNEDFEYVVETLEMEDDDLNGSRCKDQQGNADNTEDYDEDGNMNIAIDEHDKDPSIGKIKLEREEDDDDCQDTLAQAMAHVHGEYLDGSDEQPNVEMEMIVGENEIIQEGDNEMSANSAEDEPDESQANYHEDIKRSAGEKSSGQEGDSSEAGSESEMSPAQRLKELGKSFKNLKEVLNSPTLSVAAGQSPFGTPQSIPSGQTKTIKLNSGKTVTLRAGTQYVLSNLKGNNISSLLLPDRKRAVQNDPPNRSGQPNSTMKAQTTKSSVATASTSRHNSSQESGKSGGTKMPFISTHVLDTSKGLPIGGLQVSLYKLMGGRWTFLNESNTSPNGRCNDLVDNSKSSFTAGRYKMHFDVDKYFTLRRIETIYPFIEIVFDVKNPTGNYHIPVLLSPFGYTTYRGSER